ncbi:MAG TPA: U32 family peptidase [Clostridiaceae bacterium]|nr:U32 family peptidase [Clostridiaceae bacterium]
MRKPPELLAPAGNFEALKAAVENGADAVYLGGKLFNARQYASNFDNDELEKAIDFSHVRGVKVYLTLNTLISDFEMEEALSFAGQAYNMGIDGIIVQDLGLARLIKENIPRLDLHASTQMTVYNSEGIEFLSKMGFKRVVLAREVPLEEISIITKYCADKNIEIEIFVHGALCISYSGQCLMSSIIGGRSGNRGRCAQPCRLPYRLVKRIGSGSQEIGSDKKVGKNKEERVNEGELIIEKNKGGYDFGACSDKHYIMSPKDICAINDLEEIIKAGVKALKIEGRMKSPEYVAIVVGLYRKYLDKVSENDYMTGNTGIDVLPADMKKLHQIFNRGGFSKGYLYGKTGKDMMSFEKPKNWGVYLGTVISYDSKMKQAKIKLEDSLSIGDGIEIWNKDEGESPGTVVSEIIRNKVNVREAVAGDSVLVGRISGKIERGNKVYKTSSKELTEEARRTWMHGYKRFVPISGELYIKLGEFPLLKVKDNDGNEVEVKGEIKVEKAINVGINENRAKEQINKTGGTPFKFEELSVFLDEDVAIPIKELNNLRRKALEELELKRILTAKRNRVAVDINILRNVISNLNHQEHDHHGKPKISVLFYNIDKEKLDKLVKMNESQGLSVYRIYLPFDFFLKHGSKSIKGTDESNQAACVETEIFVWLPAITRGNYDLLIKRNLPWIIDMGVDGILTGNVGTLQYVRNLLGDLKYISKNIKLACDCSYNTYNSYTADTLYNAGADAVTFSYELTLEQIEKIIRRLDYKWPNKEKEIVVYGRIPLMITEYCPVNALNEITFTPCTNKSCTKGTYFLQDRMKELFPLYNDRIDCRTIVFNSKVLFMADDMGRIAKTGADLLRLNIWDENVDEAVNLIKMHRDLLKDDFNRELKKYENEIELIKSKGFTRGHFYRGV